MRIASAASSDRDTLAATKAASDAVLARLAGAPVDLACFFISRHHGVRIEEAFSLASERLGARHFLGCTAESVLAGDEELDGRPGVALWAGSLPGVDIRSGWIRTGTAPGDPPFTGLPDFARVPEGPPEPGTMVLLGEPFSFPAEEFIGRLGEDHPRLQIAGGMASAAQAPGENRLFHGSRVLSEGAVAVLLHGGVELHIVVSQGCRPFGKPLVVTRSQGTVVLQLGGMRALDKFAEQAAHLEAADMECLSQGLHLGRAVDASRASAGQGEYLVRNVIGFDRESGAMGVTGEVRAGETVQFHMRDPRSAGEELRTLLAEARRAVSPPAGALLFTCNGRGRRLFDRPHHDASAVRRCFGNLPLAGFFAAGEIGPLGGESFLHGFTAVVVLFCPAAGDGSRSPAAELDGERV